MAHRLLRSRRFLVLAAVLAAAALAAGVALGRGERALRAAATYTAVAAGVFYSNGTPLAPTYGGLRVTADPAIRGEYDLLFDGYVAITGAYVVKGTLLSSTLTRRGGTIQYVRQGSATGIRIRILGPDGYVIPAGFMVEVSRIA